MKIIKTIFFLLLSTFGWCQAQTVESLFKERNFDSVISILTEKQRTAELSFREYFLLSRSYVRERQFNNGYVLTTEMIAKAAKNKDTANLLKGLNLKTEHIIELSKIKEGAKFCDSITPLYRVKDSMELMSLCFKCGMIYNYNYQPEKAYDTYQKITKKKYRNLPLFSNNFAIILKELGRYDEALVYLKKSLEIKRKSKRQFYQLSIEYSNIAQIYLHKEDWGMAKEYLDSSYSEVNKNSRLHSKISLFENYYYLYNKQGEIEKAGIVLDSIFTINKEILEQRVVEKIHSIEAASNKEDILIKRARFVDNELEVSKNETLKGLVIFLTLILILIIIVFVLKYRQIQSYYKNILTEQQLNWVKLNPEYMSTSFETMQRMIHDKNPKTIKYLSKFSKLLRLILEGSRKSLISLEEEINAIKYYLETQQLETNNSFAFHISIDEALEEEEIYIPHMLIQPFVNEFLKKSRVKLVIGHVIDIAILYNNDTLSCVIIDTNALDSKEEQIIYNKKVEILEKTKEVLQVFTKKLNVPSNVRLEDIQSSTINGSKVTLTLPYKNETL